MDSNTRRTVTNLARKVRAWCEAENVKLETPKNKNLCGWCAIATARLWKELNAQGVKGQIHLSLSGPCAHVFLVVDDHIVDVTATQFPQFRNEKLVILHEKEAEGYWFYKAEKKFDNTDKLREDQVASGWPACQTAEA